MAKPKLPKLQPVDYAVMFGGPILFLIVAVLGIRALLGPAPQVDPIRAIRNEEIRSGMSRNEVLDKLGAPSQDTGTTLTYRRTVWDENRKEFAQDEGTIELDGSERVISTKVERLQPPAPSNAP